MKLFIAPQSMELYAFEADGSQDSLITADMIPLVSERPSQFHNPVIVNGVHTGWTLDAQAQAEALALAEAQAEKQQLNEEFEPAKLAPALKVLTEKLLTADIAAETLSETDAQAVTILFPKWEAGVAYPLGRVMQYNSHLYEVMQAHTSQADWAPDVAVGLFRRRYAPAGGIADWVEWDGHNASLYQVGSEVMHKGSHWVSNTPDNHWEPGVFGWDEVVN